MILTLNSHSRPYLIFGVEEAVKEAQKGGSGVVIYFRKEGRALGEVTKYLVYNARMHPLKLELLTSLSLTLHKPRQTGDRSYICSLTLLIPWQANCSRGASEYFQRTENIAGVKVGKYQTFISLNSVLTGAGYAVSSTNAGCMSTKLGFCGLH